MCHSSGGGLAFWSNAGAGLQDDAWSFDEGSVVRLHLNRGTWQLVCREDYWWMLRLLGSRSIATIKGWMHSNGVDIPEDELMKIRGILVREACRGDSVTKEDFAGAIEYEGITMDAHRLSYHIRMAELSGILCSGDLHPRKSTYSLTELKIGVETSGIDREKSLAMLARKYFRSHSPATFEDFVWWSGLGTTDCRRAVELLGGELTGETISGREFLVHDSCLTTGICGGGVMLLPPYDEYLIGYKSRDVVLDAAHAHRAHNRSGIFYPVILNDGIVCGNWKPSDLSVEFFDGSAPGLCSAGKAVREYGEFVRG